MYEAKSASLEEGSAVRHTHMSTNYEEIAQDALSKEQCCKKCCLLTKTSTFGEAILLVKECRESLHNLCGVGCVCVQ